MQRITCIEDDSKVLRTDPDSIAEVFAQFYESLYAEADGQPCIEVPEEEKCDAISAEEVREALRRMKNGKTAASDGLVAEMLKTGHRGLLDAIATFFTGILSGKLEAPCHWKAVQLKLIFKGGDATLPKNYRPISIIPVMAKLFSTILYTRMREVVEPNLSEEQFGFRRGRGCTDAVHVLRLVVEKSAEWGEQLWIAALDVEKAFDQVHHEDLFDALLASTVDLKIVNALRTLYTDMTASVSLWAGMESRSVKVERGVRQGDPLSPLLFNMLLDQVLEEVRVVWRRRGYGTNVGQTGSERLTHIAFADDMTLIARSWLSLKRMISLLRAALLQRGLKLHPSKCKVQTNSNDCHVRGRVQVDEEFFVEVLDEGAALNFLGTELDLHDSTAVAVQNRIVAGWRCFWSMKQLLLNRNVSANQRLKLFDATVGSVVFIAANLGHLGWKSSAN